MCMTVRRRYAAARFVRGLRTEMKSRLQEQVALGEPVPIAVLERPFSQVVPYHRAAHECVHTCIRYCFMTLHDMMTLCGREVT